MRTQQQYNGSQSSGSRREKLIEEAAGRCRAAARTELDVYTALSLGPSGIEAGLQLRFQGQQTKKAEEAQAEYRFSAGRNPTCAEMP
jgi:hypothetical protein